MMRPPLIRYRIQATRTAPRRWHMVMVTPALGSALVCSFDTFPEALDQATKLADRDRRQLVAV